MCILPGESAVFCGTPPDMPPPTESLEVCRDRGEDSAMGTEEGDMGGACCCSCLEGEAPKEVLPAMAEDGDES